MNKTVLNSKKFPILKNFLKYQSIYLYHDCWHDLLAKKEKFKL